MEIKNILEWIEEEQNICDDDKIIFLAVLSRYAYSEASSIQHLRNSIQD